MGQCFGTGTKETAAATSDERTSVGKQLQTAALRAARVIFVLGGPGSGKGTQCEKIVARYGYTHLSTGDLLRAEVASGSARGVELKKTMESGALVSLDVVLSLLKDAMLQAAPTARGFLIDGFPRELEQAKRFENEIAQCERCVYFEVSDETMKKRLLKRGETSGRSDDNEETIAKRVATFHEVSEPVIDYYRQKDKLLAVRAESDVDTVFVSVRNAFDKLALKDANVVFVLGGPGSGKGTQCERIVERYGFTHLSTGDLLRDELKSGSARATQLQQVMESGGLVSLDVVLELLKDAMLRTAHSARGFLVDGFPRELEQATRFEEEVAVARGCLYFEVSDETMKTRLLKRAQTSGRVDDNEATIRKRLDTFHKLTEPVIQYCKQKEKLWAVNAEGDVGAVFEQVKIMFNELTLKATPIVFVLGGPGSGKGTQCEKIVARYGYTHLSTGDLLRAEVASGSMRGNELKKTMESGALVTLDVVLQLLRDAMLAQAGAARGFLVDGFPRELEQATRFEKEIARPRCCLSFEVTDETMLKRLLHRAKTSGRVDDNEETIKKRLQTFHAVTEPVITHYREAGLLVQVRAEQEADTVFQAVALLCDNLSGYHLLKQAQVLFVLGGPGSGKGTQCEKIVARWGFEHLSSGDLLRAEVASGSAQGNELKKTMESGALVSLDVVLGLLRNAMVSAIARKGCKRFLIDGFPRDLEQAKRFEAEVVVGLCCLYLEVSDETMKKRLMKRGESSGRVDDNEETIVKRLSTFHAATEPVAQYFEGKGRLRKVAAEGTIDDTFVLVEKEVGAVLAS